MDKKRISFLFGAGAEGKNNYSFPNGFEYLQKSLFDEVHKTKVTTSLKKFFVYDYYHNGYRYTANTVQPTITSLRELVLQKIRESVNNGFYNKFRYYILSIFSNTSIDDIKNEFEQLYNDYHNKEIKRSNSVDRIVTEYKSIISGSINKYSDIKNSFLKELFDQTEDGKIGIDFDCHIGSILDSYFHTIINPPKYGYILFSRIFNYYCIYRSQNRICTDLKPYFNGYKTAPLPLLNRTMYI